MLPFCLSWLFIVSLLFTSIEGTMDAIAGEHPHGDKHTHQMDNTHEGLAPSSKLFHSVQISHDQIDHDQIDHGFAEPLAWSNEKPLAWLSKKPSQDVLDDNSEVVDHCQHCCHGHGSFATGSIAMLGGQAVYMTISFNHPHLFDFSQKPPTPPPTV